MYDTDMLLLNRRSDNMRGGTAEWVSIPVDDREYVFRVDFSEGQTRTMGRNGEIYHKANVYF